MKFRGRELSDVDRDVLEQLVVDGLAEDTDLDFKGTLNLDGDQKTRFLKDVTAFANTAGGFILCGVEEEEKVAKRIVGLSVEDRDKLELRIHNIILSGTDPQVLGVAVKFIPVPPDRCVVIVAVPQSWLNPHMVKDDRGFWARHSGGNHSLGTAALRSAFVQSESRTDRIRSFRDGRLARIPAGEGAMPLSDPIVSVLHVVPLKAMDPSFRVDLSGLYSKGQQWQILYRPGWQGSHPSFDGFLFQGGVSPSGVTRYLQVFRNGAIEAVFTTNPQSSSWNPEAHYVCMQGLESDSWEALQAAFAYLREADVEPPVFIMLALCGARGMYIGEPRGARWDDKLLQRVNRDTLVVPEDLVESLDDYDDADARLHRMFDAVWNASGWDGSHSYGKDRR